MKRKPVAVSASSVSAVKSTFFRFERLHARRSSYPLSRRPMILSEKRWMNRRSSSRRKKTLAIMGMKERLTKRDAVTATTITTVSDEKKTPTRPRMKASGSSTTTVVRVEAIIADCTSPVPTMLAALFRAPFSRW